MTDLMFEIPGSEYKGDILMTLENDKIVYKKQNTIAA